MPTESWKSSPFRFRVRDASGEQIAVKNVEWPVAGQGGEGDAGHVHLIVEGAAGRGYRLEAGGQAFEGTVGADCVIDHPLPERATTGTLTFKGGQAYQLHFGKLPGLDTLAGLQMRLNALGHIAGKSGIMDDHTRAALKEFQEQSGLEATGELDEATRARLEHDYETR